MRIALDAHGGDFGVPRNISAVLELASDPKIRLILVGRKPDIEAELQRCNTPVDAFEIVHAEEQIGMGESAVHSVRRKANNSITVALGLMKSGAADAVVSAGHSGAVVAAALMTLGRIRGVSRPPLGTRIPAINTYNSYALDIGAVIDPKPEMLLQFGYLGAAYSKAVLDVPNPSVALLSNGEETSKGNALTRAAQELFERSDLNYIGYVEGGEMLDKPPAVTVTDGFTGNIGLKIAEGTAASIQSALRRELTANWRDKLLAMMLRPAFRRMRDNMDFEGIGGAALLGVNGVVIVAHGRSTTRGLVSAIRTAEHAAEVRLPELLRDAIPARDRSVPETSDATAATVS
ncbi:MAG TPA: phosphate acyltransferase PlsX [Thermomicrobiales bacterium]|nr:phosphate acyltransferase PlsX [Thermomicrobiales bacterium]